jgi:hypothetical protein
MQRLVALLIVALFIVSCGQKNSDCTAFIDCKDIPNAICRDNCLPDEVVFDQAKSMEGKNRGQIICATCPKDKTKQVCCMKKKEIVSGPDKQ